DVLAAAPAWPIADSVENWSPSPSPDGRVVFVSDRSGAPRGWVQSTAPGTPAQLDTGAEPVKQVSWSPDGDWIAYVVAPGGAPRTEVWVLRADGSGPRQVAGFDADTATMTGWLPGTTLLMVTETATTSRPALVDVAAGTTRVLAEGDLIALLDVTPDLGTALVRCGPRGGRWLELLDVATGERRPLPAGVGEGCTDQGWFSADGRTVYARTDVDMELAALVAIDLDALAATPPGAPPQAADPTPGGPVVLARRHDAELEDVTLAADRRTAVLLWNRYGGRSELALLDLETGTQRSLPSPAGEVFDGCAFAPDGGLLCLTAQSPVQPRGVWLVDLTVGSAWALGDDPMIASAPVAPRNQVAPQLCDLRSGDGLPLSGWLYRPEGDGPWPTVISLHGGPEAQERPQYNPLFQSLVARGLAVFAPNVRGSSGFGRSFVEADNRAGRYGAIADVAACVQFLTDNAVARPDRVACIGRSYGGYLTLAALVTFPEMFAVGVSECGMSNFETFFERTEPWIAAAAVRKYGDPEHDRELLRDLSPLHRLDRLAAPLLLLHGANDSNVPVHESDQVAEALQARGAPYSYVVLPGEGHDFVSRCSRAEAIATTGAWLARHLLPDHR
ncbi:MAG TPA: prolyl oligopeptidase family serine peptidase, partial [Catenuloplanes sp.]